MPYVDPKARANLIPAIERLEQDIRERKLWCRSINDKTPEVWLTIKDLLLSLSFGNTVHEPSINVDLAVKVLRAIDYKPGDLNYTVCLLLWRHHFQKKISYTKLDEALDYLEDIKAGMPKGKGTVMAIELELYRRLGADYEDEKKLENGEVFDGLDEFLSKM
jgi:hypothetical protein